MSDLTFNKIAGAALATGLAMIGLGQLSAGIFGSEAPAKPGYLVEVVEEGGSEAVVADTPPMRCQVPPSSSENHHVPFD